jgi:uncharacterized protein YdiU (UPF0061 family)
MDVFNPAAVYRSNHDKAIALAEDTINQFPAYYERYWREGMGRKLGLVSEQPDDVNLVHELLALMQEHAADYTNTFRLLGAVAEGDTAPAGYEAWVTRWQRRLEQEPHSRPAAVALMRTTNPAVIPRNHRVEAAINAAVQQSDFAPVETLLIVLSKPFDLKPEHAEYSAPPAPSERVLQTYCGT